jgi:sulfite reductase alpha subunit-like flavoprotein
MVCAGSGIGPFLGFLEHRKQLDIKTGFAWLVFGCRHKGRDDLHMDKLNSYLQEGYLSKLSLAYSRDESPDNRAKYVQDSLENHADQVVNMVTEEGAGVFVCGDAKNMGKGVYDTFVKMLSIDGKNGGEVMLSLVGEKRYKQDLWN